MNARYATNLWTTVILAAAISTAINAPAAAAMDEADSRLMVKFAADVTEAEVAAVLKRHMSREIGRIDRLGLRIIETPAGLGGLVNASIAAQPRVELAELDRAYAPRETTPNDTYYGYAWHLPKIGAPVAWDFSMGAGVTVAVVDAGVDAAHPDLAGRLVPGWNTASDSADTSDLTGHGTRVAGVIGAATDNATGVAGLTWDSAIMPMRVTDSPDGVAYGTEIVAAIVWAADNGARVANLAYSMPTNGSIAAAAEYMRSLGGVVVMPSGNDGLYFPNADVSSVILVSATDSGDLVTTWSNTGTNIDLSAPGASIVTTNKGGGYTSTSGTSYASPMVAGVAALVIAANPSLSADEIEQILEDSAVDLGAPGYDGSYGHGRVDADAAVQMALAWVPATVDEEAPSVSIDSPAAGSLVEGTVTVALSAADNVGVTEVRLFADGALIGSDAEAPYAIDLDTTAYANGALQLTATAYDAAGNEALSDAVSLTVDNYSAPVDVTPPTAAITSPSDNARVRNTVTIQAVASDDVALASMTLYVNGAELCTGAGPSLSCNWDSNSVGRGYHTIDLVATDTSGNSSSDQVRVRR